MKKAIIILGLISGLLLIYHYFPKSKIVEPIVTENLDGGGIDYGKPGLDPFPLSIDYLKQGNYPGSDLVLINDLPDRSNYTQQVVSYKSEGNKIRALMTIPSGDKPESGWPVVIFNHGYIPPKEYRTTEKYTSYVDYFAKNGYIVFKSDYRGHGDSEGDAAGGYGSNAYTIDILNAVSAVKLHPDVDSSRIGMWGHSMGGHITLRVMVTTKEVKAGVIWGGVVASYPELLSNWRRRNFTPPPTVSTGARRWRDELIAQFGTPEANPGFWDSISATSYLADISGPLELHHAKGDESVPYDFSEKLKIRLDAANKISNLFLYEGDDHNISENFAVAMKRSLDFFDFHLKVTD